MNSLPTDRRPRIGVVGMGAFGALHAGHWVASDGALLTALVEPDARRREEIARRFPAAKTFATLEELACAQAADAVVIATRTDTHAPLALQAMEAGLHVFLEKPAAENPAQIRELIACRDRTGRVIMVDHICLFHSLIGPLIARVGEQGFRAAHFVRHRPAALARRFPEAHPLSLLIVHDLIVAARLAGGEDPVEYQLIELPSAHGGIDMCWATLRWQDGRTATFQSHCTLPASAPSDGWDTLEVFGAEYHTRVDTNPAPWHWQGEKPEWPVALEISQVQGRPTGMLAEAQRSFLTALAGAPVPEGCRLEDALQIEQWMARLFQTV